MRDATRGAAGSLLAIVVGCAVGCAPSAPEQGSRSSPEAAAVAAIDPPAADGAFAPDVWADGDGVLMTWLEPLGAERSAGHRVRFSKLEDGVWTPPVTIVEGRDLFANWADFPSPARAADGTIYVHWLAKTAPATFAYSIFLARSSDGGASWTRVGKLNDDATHTEHGFVSWVRDGDELRAFWLDGREMEHDGPMTFRTARVSSGGPAPVGSVELLDERVCECCSTDATVTESGALAVYRDRSDTEVRDVYSVRRIAEGWSIPEVVAADEWRIEGCPVNGPAVAAAGRSVATAWFTASGTGPRVSASLSTDGGATFGEPHLMDGDQTLGRVHVAMIDADRAVVAWYDVHGDRAAVSLRAIGPDGVSPETVVVGSTSMARSSGFPRVARVGESLLVAWTEILDGAPPRIRTQLLPLASIPL